MHKIKVAGLLLVLAVFMGGISQKASADFMTEKQVNIQTNVIEGFEEKDAWQVKFSKFRCRNWNQEKKDAPDESASWLTWIEATADKIDILPDGLPRDVRGTKEKTIMAVKGCFDTKGYNWIVLEPKKPLIPQGITRAIDLWVWSSGYNYDAYVVIKNWQGFYYSLYMGNLSYYGWKNLRAEIPYTVSQLTQYVPRVKPIEVVRIKLVAAPHEKPDGFYAYFDYMQTQSDIYVPRYSGDALSENKW